MKDGIVVTPYGSRGSLPNSLISPGSARFAMSR